MPPDQLAALATLAQAPAYDSIAIRLTFGLAPTLRFQLVTVATTARLSFLA